MEQERQRQVRGTSATKWDRKHERRIQVEAMSKTAWESETARKRERQ